MRFPKVKLRFCISTFILYIKIAPVLSLLQFGESQVSLKHPLKSSKSAAGVGARANFDIVTNIVFYPKIALMLYWLHFGEHYGSSCPGLFFDSAA